MDIKKIIKIFSIVFQFVKYFQKVLHEKHLTLKGKMNS